MILSVVLATCFFLCARGDTTTDPTTTVPEQLKWLEKHVRSDGTLDFLKGSYTLGMNATEPAEPIECTTTNGNQGRCRLLKNCPTIYPKLTDEYVFKEYFCAINTYAGVCCTDS